MLCDLKSMVAIFKFFLSGTAPRCDMPLVPLAFYQWCQSTQRGTSFLTTAPKEPEDCLGKAVWRLIWPGNVIPATSTIHKFNLQPCCPSTEEPTRADLLHRRSGISGVQHLKGAVPDFLLFATRRLATRLHMIRSRALSQFFFRPHQPL